MDLATGNIAAKHQHQDPMILASVSKVFTSYFALTQLGAEYRFHTKVYRQGKLENGTLKGNLYLVGSGAPYLTAPHLISLIHQIKKAGIKKIDGKFILDDSALINKNKISILGLEDQADNPAIGALNVEFNRFSVHQSKEVHPPLTHIKLVEKNKASNGLKFDHLEINEEQEVWQVNTHESIAKIEDLPTRDSTLFTGNFFQYLANLHGVELPAPITGKLNDSAQEIAHHNGLPLSRLVALGIEYSNNLIAEVLLLSSAKQLTGKNMMNQDAAKTMHDFLKKRFSHINWKKSSFINGSGLTVNNQVSALTMAQFLQAIEKDDFAGRSYWSFFSINAHSGSIGRRLKDPELAYRIYGKTGSLFFVNNLAGYLISKSGKRYAYAIFTTHHNNRTQLNQKNSAKNKKLRDSNYQWYKNMQRLQDELLTNWVLEL